MKDRCQHKGTELCLHQRLDNVQHAYDHRHTKTQQTLSLLLVSNVRYSTLCCLSRSSATLKVPPSMESELSSHRCTVGLTDIHYTTCFISCYSPHQTIALHAKLYKTRFHINISIVCVLNQQLKHT